ncbi:MAG TPA: hypothetical protein VN656_01545 [Stellaceae bacterium]|jgi:hypothetical protein|nr:hypothetical protein [Stellaceae bacterium]
MSLETNLLRSALALGACAVVVGGVSGPAAARVVVGFGFGVPVVPAPWYYAPPPVVYAPPPVVYAPPPVAVAPQPAYVAQPNQDWYYCDDPRGYYPYVASCNSGWHQVPAQPNAAPPQH